MPAQRLPSPVLARTPSAPERPAALDAALERIEAGAVPERAEAEALLDARGDDLDRLLAVAGAVRDAGLDAAGRGRILTYSRKVFIPVTHLCRDRCHYCVFVQTPAKLERAGIAPYLDEDEVVRLAAEGASLGCKEALFTLGDRPEDRWPAARRWLADHGFASTIDYLAHLAERVTRETGLLVHMNPGVMSWAELQRLKPLAPSMGMMLETTSRRLYEERGLAHFGSPDKDPALRLRVLDDAGASRIPFTTGVLLGIGETTAERVDALLAIRERMERDGAIQEVIVQNFRAKDATAMMRADDLGTEEYAAGVAVARLLLGPAAHVQAPPNLTDEAELALLVRAGIDDWGGVSPLTPDHVNPERPWPHIDDLASRTAALGYTLRERLTAQPEYVRAGTPWIDDRLLPRLLAVADADGLADESAAVGPAIAHSSSAPHPASAFRELLDLAVADPAALDDGAACRLLAATGADLDALTAAADAVRRAAVGDAITVVANRNIDGTRIGTPGGLALDDVAIIARDAWATGCTELCIQGAPAASVRLIDVVRAVREAAPGLHLHAFRPAEHLAAAGGDLGGHFDALRAAGLGSVPGTGARVLDDALRQRTLPGDLPVADWIRAITTAHAHGLRSTATLVHGIGERPAQIVAHLRLLAHVQDATGGFTEFIPMPGGAHVDEREVRAVTAVARLLLAGRIDRIQTAWTKVGLRLAERLLDCGADDLGGLLVTGSLHRDAGAEAGRELRLEDAVRLADGLGRPLRQRTTLYGGPSAERLAALRGSTPAPRLVESAEARALAVP